jgi:hypothetical protein
MCWENPCQAHRLRLGAVDRGSHSVRTTRIAHLRESARVPPSGIDWLIEMGRVSDHIAACLRMEGQDDLSMTPGGIAAWQV